MTDDLRLIEDYLPIEAISKEASREKSVRKGHISTLHLWWARRPLVACRAAVYGALVPADRWVKDVDLKNPPADSEKAEKITNGKKKGLNRKAAKDFVTKLCRYPKTDPTKPADIKIKRETEAAIVEAQRHILEAHADRLTAELADARKLPLPPGEGWGEGTPGWLSEFKWPRDKTVVTYDDIVAGRAPRPRVLDMFAGGGAIPLEALRLGCEAYALDLNPVAHIIQLCTLVYPQKYGKPDPTARGMTGPKDAKGETTWGGLAAEVSHWGKWVLDKVRKEIGDLYPPIPDPAVWDTPPEIAFDRQTGEWDITKPGKPKPGVKVDDLAPKIGKQMSMDCDSSEDDDEEGTGESLAAAIPPGFLQPVAYLWTRTVRCKNPACGAAVPLLRQTWLRKKAKRYVAVNMIVPKNAKQVCFAIVESETESGLGFDPAGFSQAGNATCPFCGTVADTEYVKAEGYEDRIGEQYMATVCTQHRRTGRRYVREDDGHIGLVIQHVSSRLQDRSEAGGLGIPPERLEANPRSFDIQRYGIGFQKQLFAKRQLLALMSLSDSAQEAHKPMAHPERASDRSRAITAYLGCVLDRVAAYCSRFCTWHNTGEKMNPTHGRQSLGMVWDYAEVNPIGNASGNAHGALVWVLEVIKACANTGIDAHVQRGTALETGYPDDLLDAVVTDPPYYDNISYSNLSDYYYIWLKRLLAPLFPEHFGTELTPKKQEAIAAPYRHEDDAKMAAAAYEQMMCAAFREASRALKRTGAIVIVYAHKTTLGWSTLIESLRASGFTVVEAWPLDTEMTAGRRIGMAMLASSIFLVARKRDSSSGVGNYEDDVQPELQQIVRERVETLWDMGIAGADLVIACVGAGLRAFTKFEKVEYANGEEVPAEKFLAEVESVVLDTMLAKLSGVAGGNVSTVDNASRFYVLWRFVYKTAELDAGEAIVFSNGTHIELDGPQGLSAGKDALVEKKKAKYRARDYAERGSDENLGLPTESGQSAPLIDALHRILWLMDNSPRKLNEFLDEARPDRERLRVLAQALAGAALSGKSEEDAAKLVATTPAEQSALGKLLANWRSLVESRLTADEGTLFGKTGYI